MTQALNWRDKILLLPDGQQIHAVMGLHTDQKDDQPVLVFLHEALGHIRMWKDFPERLALATGLDVMVYERLGYGESSPITLPRADDYLVPEGEQRLGEVLEAAGIDKAILVGHSDGGTIALIGAASLPDKVVAIITEAAHVYADELTLKGIREAAEVYKTTNLGERLARYHGDRTDLLFRAWTETWLRESCHQNMDFQCWLPDIRCPALIMQGKQDQYGVPEQVADICKGIGEQAEACFVDGCAHIPHLEATEAVLELMSGFIQRVTVTA